MAIVESEESTMYTGSDINNQFPALKGLVRQIKTAPHEVKAVVNKKPAMEDHESGFKIRTYQKSTFVRNTIGG